MKHTKFVMAVLVPAFLFLGYFVFYPVIYGLFISFFDFNPTSSVQPFVGLDNYARLVHDPVFWKAVGNTFFFCFVTVALNIVISLFLASIICAIPSKGLRTLFRTIIFIPCIAPIVGTSIVWKHGIIAVDSGLLNQVLKFLFNMPAKNWLLTGMPMMMIIIVYTLWADIGYNVILFTAGLESIPKSFEEAAMVDGAGALRRFLSVRLPLMRRTFVFVAIMSVADYFQQFAQFRVLVADGGRDFSVMVLTNYIYRTSFTSFDMGYASAIAAALFIIVFIVALIQNRIMRADWSYE
ncbi:MAG: carbohydrate ABC transporter permease [Atopobiaceae bacterium]|jgi:multiple sugar transport system permease protein